MSKDKLNENLSDKKIAENSDVNLCSSGDEIKLSDSKDDDYSRCSIKAQNNGNSLSHLSDESVESENFEHKEKQKDFPKRENKLSNGKRRFKIRTADIAVTAVMTALVIVFTSFIKVPIGAGGYIHLGDLMILLSASILPLPFALLSSCVGAALSDVIVGAPIWAPFSLIVKALIVLCFTAKKDKILCARNFIGCGLSCIITVVGYFFSEVIIYGNWGAYVSMPWNLVQAVVAAVGYMVIGVAFDKMKVKKFIYKK